MAVGRARARELCTHAASACCQKNNVGARARPPPTRQLVYLFRRVPEGFKVLQEGKARILQKGNRLSITPVDPREWNFITKKLIKAAS